MDIDESLKEKLEEKKSAYMKAALFYQLVWNGSIFGKLIVGVILFFFLSSLMLMAQSFLPS